MLSGVVGWNVVVSKKEVVVPADPIVFDEVLRKVAGNIMNWVDASSNSRDWNLTVRLKSDGEFEYFVALSETGEWMVFRSRIRQEVGGI